MLILVGFLLTAPALIAGEKVYQWTDKDGNVNFSSQPPPAGTEVVEKDLEPMPNVGTVDPNLDSLEIRKAVAEMASRENDALMQHRMETTTYEEQQAIECELAQGVLDKLTSGRLAKIASPDGNLRDMSEAERKNRIRASEKYINENCR